MANASQEAGWWIATVLVLALFAAICGRVAYVVLWSQAPDHTRRECAVAMSSAFFFCLMVVPFFTSSAWAKTYPEFQDNYVWLPVYYAFVLGKFAGDFYELAFHSVVGTLFGAFGMLILTHLMPGGMAGAESQVGRMSWLPGGFNEPVAMVYATCFVYVTFLFGFSVTFKQYALGFFAGSFVPYLNGADTSFRYAFWDDNYSMNWQSPVLNSLYIVLLAVPLGFLSQPVCCHRTRWRRMYSAAADIANHASSVAEDTATALSRMVTYFCEDTATYDLDSAYLYVRQLGTRRRVLESLMDMALWEGCDARARKRCGCLKLMLFSLRGFRQVLRCQLEQLRSQGHKIDQVHKGLLEEHLFRFEMECCTALETMATEAYASQSQPECFGEASRAEISACATRAEEALLGALAALDAVGPGPALERAFVDGLRNCTVLIRLFLEDLDAMEEHLRRERRKGLLRRILHWASKWSPANTAKDWDAHSNALRNTTSWMLAVFWGRYFRHYSATTPSVVSFIFSPNLGSLFERNANRMVGIGMGLVLGNLPATLLIDQSAACDAASCFDYWPQGIIIYLALMYMIWGVTVYGYLATRHGVGVRWSYACLLCAGYGGVHTLRNVRRSVSVDRLEAANFRTILDNFTSCIIVFVVDFAFYALLRIRTTDRVTAAITKAFTDIAAIVEQVHDGNFGDPGVSVEKEAGILALSRRIAEVRNLDSEVAKQDLAFNSLTNAPYKTDLIRALMDRLDDAYVALYGVMASARRSSDLQVAAAILRKAMPRHFAADWRGGGAAAAAALGEQASEHLRVRNSRPSWQAAQASDLLAGQDPKPSESTTNQEPGESCSEPSKPQMEGIQNSGADGAPGADLEDANVSPVLRVRPGRMMASSASSACRPSDATVAGEVAPPAGSGGKVVPPVLAVAAAASSAAEAALTVHAAALALVLRQVRALLQEHDFWKQAQESRVNFPEESSSSEKRGVVPKEQREEELSKEQAFWQEMASERRGFSKERRERREQAAKEAPRLEGNAARGQVGREEGAPDDGPGCSA